MNAALLSCSPSFGLQNKWCSPKDLLKTFPFAFFRLQKCFHTFYARRVGDQDTSIPQTSKVFKRLIWCVRLHLMRLWLVILMTITTETHTCDNSSPSFSWGLEGLKLIARPPHLFILHKTFDTLPTVQTNKRQAVGQTGPGRTTNRPTFLPSWSCASLVSLPSH